MDLELTLNGAKGTVRLWQDVAPKTVAAMVANLPLEAKFNQCRWSGDACFTDFHAGGPLSDIDQLELPVVSIYPGTVTVRLGEPGAEAPELLIGYGIAEHRWPTGPKPVVPVGEITEGREELFAVMRSIAANGPADITLRAIEGGAAE
jgi:hypothetical protein